MSVLMVALLRVGWDGGVRVHRGGCGGDGVVDRGERRTRDGMPRRGASSTTARGQANVRSGQRHIRRDMRPRLGASSATR
ncbi:hypothetical protein B8281_07190 [Cellulosimicrobium sp. TH-20]|nr:hypothetical protein B8281_07190 [Cellulosimicrobium sp. TH-20]